MFVPIQRNGVLYKLSEVNAFGEAEHSTTGTPFGWGAIHFRKSLNSSSVRADASASKARAEGETIDGRIIIEKAVNPILGDKVVLGELGEYEIQRVQPRRAINGTLHHWEVDLREV